MSAIVFVFDSRSRLAKDIPLQSKENSHNNEMGDWNNFQIILLESAKAKKLFTKKEALVHGPSINKFIKADNEL